MLCRSADKFPCSKWCKRQAAWQSVTLQLASFELQCLDNTSGKPKQPCTSHTANVEEAYVLGYAARGKRGLHLDESTRHRACTAGGHAARGERGIQMNKALVPMACYAGEVIWRVHYAHMGSPAFQLLSNSSTGPPPQATPGKARALSLV